MFTPLNNFLPIHLHIWASLNHSSFLLISRIPFNGARIRCHQKLCLYPWKRHHPSPRRRLYEPEAIIDYNRRNEKLSKDDLKKRGYDENGWPFALCGLLCRPNGFDKDRGRVAFSCFQHCLTLKYKALDDLQKRFDISSCPYLQNKAGFTKHMSIKDYPRLINEIPRGTKRYKEIKKLRSASLRGVGPTGRRLKEPTPPSKRISLS